MKTSNPGKCLNSLLDSHLLEDYKSIIESWISDELKQYHKVFGAD